jgi:hypothetical protein
MNESPIGFNQIDVRAAYQGGELTGWSSDHLQSPGSIHTWTKTG